jgi:hypothetical protein
VAPRRTLLEGYKAQPKADRQKEKAFVYAEADQPDEEQPKPPKRKPEPKATPKEKAKEKREGAEPTPPPPPMPAATGRMPLTTRIRTDFGTALKRASLERQLSGEKPNTVQDILEEALEPWLKEKGFLKD